MEKGSHRRKYGERPLRPVEWVDDKGYKRRRLVRDGDPDTLGMLGVPEEPPDINQLDWVAIRRDLHNQLMNRKILTWKDVQVAQVGLSAAVRAAIVRPLKMLFREEDKLRR